MVARAVAAPSGVLHQVAGGSQSGQASLRVLSPASGSPARELTAAAAAEVLGVGEPTLNRALAARRKATRQH